MRNWHPHEGLGRVVEQYYWGYRRNSNPKSPFVINARQETIDTNNYWAPAFCGGRRCLIPADGWYEWCPVADAPDDPKACLAAGLTKKGKQRFFLEIRNSPIVMLAGIYGEGAVKTKGGWHREPCTVVITTAAQDSILDIDHDRQPVILTPDQYGDWLNPGAEASVAKRMLVSREYDGLLIRPVTGPV